MNFSICNINPKQGFLDDFGVRLQLVNNTNCYYTAYYEFVPLQHTEKLWLILSPHYNLQSKSVHRHLLLMTPEVRWRCGAVRVAEPAR